MIPVITWFEIQAKDLKRACDFYSKILDCNVEISEMNGFKMGFFPSDEKSIGGAIVVEPDNEPSAKGTVVYFTVESIDDTLKIVEEAGGKALSDKIKISDEIGFCAFILDSEGNRIGLYSRK